MRRALTCGTTMAIIQTRQIYVDKIRWLCVCPMSKAVEEPEEDFTFKSRRWVAVKESKAKQL